VGADADIAKMVQWSHGVQPVGEVEDSNERGTQGTQALEKEAENLIPAAPAANRTGKSLYSGSRETEKSDSFA
jgi:hypothetical protein